MKILYGIQGTGNGHITRARHMAQAFANHKDVHVDYFFSGRKADKYFDMDVFNAYQTKRGLTFVTENGKINHAQTIAQNNLFTVIKDIRQTSIKSYDLVLNDFEPITAWAAKKQNIPSLSVSHQAAFLNHVPVQNQTLLDKLVTQYFAPTEFNLGTHWYHFGHNIIPPFVARELLEQQQVKPQHTGNKILVYLPFESITLIKEHLNVVSEWEFVCYHPAITQPNKEKNIMWKPLSTTTFKQDLFACGGVISNCGFELSTECLSLGKPLLVKPLHKQYEQISNAYTLQKLGLCEVINTINAEQIDDWLQVKTGVSVQYPTDCNDLVNWIKDGNWKNQEQICKSLWQKVKFPAHVSDKLDKLQQSNI
ncbi:MAG: MJ1255/VC2487 family glycosyltransferase [Glaciecola sp.]